MEKLALAPAMLLQKIGMHPRYKGYAYVYLILSIIQEHPEYLYNMRSLVYPKLSERYQCTQAGIERNIRFAVQRTFERGDRQILSRLFRSSASEWPPTNTEFIAVLSQCLLYGYIGFNDGEELRYVVK
ncbi:MAG TPA: sporulation initiation factor Spo0A C-terminal domain-containing protein [Clostridia bacterium]|nr:sporulation initiation factor Spo0A C-terminal domain-containing protein [Clostridia bacterium]